MTPDEYERRIENYRTGYRAGMTRAIRLLKHQGRLDAAKEVQKVLDKTELVWAQR